LSLAKNTTVSSSWPDRRSAASTLPLERSRSSTISLYVSTEPPSLWNNTPGSPALMRAVSASLTALCLREVVEAAAEVAEELVPAEPGRAEPRQVAAVPLADQRGVVALALQQRRQRSPNRVGEQTDDAA
jgi:hypothetical protein